MSPLTVDVAVVSVSELGHTICNANGLVPAEDLVLMTFYFLIPH